MAFVELLECHLLFLVLFLFICYLLTCAREGITVEKVAWIAAASVAPGRVGTDLVASINSGHTLVDVYDKSIEVNIIL